MASTTTTDEETCDESQEYELYKGPFEELVLNSYDTGNIRTDLYLYGPNKLALPLTYRKWMSKISNFKLRDNDIWVVTFPKSGTTWVQEIAWCVVNDLNFAKAKKTSLLRRSPHLEMDSIFDDPLLQLLMPPVDDSDDPSTLGASWRALNSSKDAQRVIKSHLQIPQLPKGLTTSTAKIIYISRDPKDVCVSYYYYVRKIAGFCGTFDDFVNLFLADLIYTSPYWNSILSFWELRTKPNVLFITYEQMKEDTRKMLIQICKFLGKDFNSEQISSLMHHTSFESMKNNPAATIEDLITPFLDDSIKFCRKGKIGDWKSHMSKDQIRRFQQWTKDKLKGSDFPYYRN